MFRMDVINLKFKRVYGICPFYGLEDCRETNVNLGLDKHMFTLHNTTI